MGCRDGIIWVRFRPSNNVLSRVVGAKFKMHSPYEEEDERGHEEGRDERGSDDVRVRVGGEQHKPVHG